MVNPALRQYFGATRRFPGPCLELSFPAGEEKVSLAGMIAGLRASGCTLPRPIAKGELCLPLAVGELACAAVPGPVLPKWTWGIEGSTGWVCMVHPARGVVKGALWQAYEGIVRCVLGSEPVPERLRSLLTTPLLRNRQRLLLTEAASMLGLNVTAVSDRANIIQIGDGARGRHFYHLANEEDSLTGYHLAKNKLAAVELLRRLGLPTTRAVGVSTAEGIREALQRVGFPCVVKPIDRGKGHGITTNIKSARQVPAAVAHALEYGSYPILLENHVAGDDHRMLVADGRLLWVYRRRPARVMGDGQATVEELIVRENHRRDQAGWDAYLERIVLKPTLDQHLRDHYELTRSSVPAAGQGIDLDSVANLGQGGTLEDMTGAVHPDNRELAVRIARLLRSSAMGIDFVTPDIARSWREIPSAVIEVNTTPGISGLGDAALVLRSMMPRRLSGKIPIFVVMGDDDDPRQTADVLMKMLAQQKLAAAFCAYQPTPKTELSATGRAREVEALLLDPQVEAMVISCSRPCVEERGFPISSCDVLFASEPNVSAMPWVRALATRVVTDALSSDELTRLVREMSAPYQDRDNGGPRPTLELLAGADDGAGDGETIRVRCWRIRARRRKCFSKQVPLDAAGGALPTEGMIERSDLLAAVVRFADQHLSGAGRDLLGADFDAVVSTDSWANPRVDVAIRIHQERRDELLMALRAGVAAVNGLIDHED